MIVAMFIVQATGRASTKAAFLIFSLAYFLLSSWLSTSIIFLSLFHSLLLPSDTSEGQSREYWRGKHHCTIDLMLDWFGIGCMTTDDFCFYLQSRLIQTSQTGGQWYCDTSPFSIPWSSYNQALLSSNWSL